MNCVHLIEIRIMLQIYHGWKIYAYVGKPAHNEISDLKRKIKRRFDQGEWSFEDNDRTFIYNQSFDSPIEVLFVDETTEEEKAMGLSRYGLVFNADFFGYRNEYPHRQLCYEVLHKIPWQKQAYYLIDDERILVSKRRIQRRKKR